MISPELLKRYPLFGSLSTDQLKKIALISEEVPVEEGETLFKECQTADTLYVLIEGGVDLFYKSEEEFYPKNSREFLVGEIDAGEVFAISSLIEPYKLSSTARTNKRCRFIKINATALRDRMKEDPAMGLVFMNHIAQAAMERLAYTRIQLAACWAK